MACPRGPHIAVVGRLICGMKEDKRKESYPKEEVVHSVKSSKESRKIRTEVSVGCGKMEATGDLREGSSCGGREPSAANAPGPSPVPGTPPGGRSQPEWART